jgi:hypothetical protein
LEDLNYKIDIKNNNDPYYRNERDRRGALPVLHMDVPDQNDLNKQIVIVKYDAKRRRITRGMRK